jgi:hypothetical protein
VERRLFWDTQLMRGDLHRGVATRQSVQLQSWTMTVIAFTETAN